uniref:Uncharacterized protein n=1 Tax=Avena sativa TaxID=4498 RepID=A0ACD5U0H9_AVESA
MASENVVTAASLPADLVVEILSRVPFKSFCRFKCVCKAWVAFSSDPHYRQKLPKIPSFLHQGQSGTSAIQLVSLSPNKQIDGALTFVPQYEQLHLVDCCNGLVLCLYKSSRSSADTCSFIVCNPATREWRILPVPESHSHTHETGHCGCLFTAFLAFDPSWSEQFYVFNIHEHCRTGTSKHEVFSSDLSTWLVYDEWTRIRKILVNKPHSFIRGILHVQLNSMNTLVVEGLQAMSSSVAPHHSIIKMPEVSWDGCFGQSSAGFLQCAFPEEKCCSIEVFSFDACRPDKWSLKHRLNMQDAFGRCGLVTTEDYRSYRCIYAIVALDLERGSLFLFEIEPKKLLLYDIDTGKLSEVKDGHGSWSWHYHYYVACYSKLPG